jgi:hypothetical protein
MLYGARSAPSAHAIVTIEGGAGPGGSDLVTVAGTITDLPDYVSITGNSNVDYNAVWEATAIDDTTFSIPAGDPGDGTGGRWYGVLSPVQNPAATPGDGQVTLAWDLLDGAASYNVYQSTSENGTYTLVGNVTDDADLEDFLDNGTTYWFKVAAVDAAGREGALSAAVSATPNPPDPILSLSPLLWESADVAAYTDAGTTLATDGQTVRQYGDRSGNANTATQATSGLRPVWHSNVVGSLPMIQPDAADDVMGLAAALSFGTAAFTVYAVGTRASGSIWVPLGHATTSATLVLYSDNKVYVLVDGGTFISHNYTGSTGTIIVRFRRTAAGSVKVAATGMAEVTVGDATDPMTFNTIFSQPVNGYFNGGTNKHGELLAWASDLVTDDPTGDATVLAYLADRWGVTLP